MYPTLYILSVAVGLAAHQGIFIRGEWHLKTQRVVYGHLALAAGFFYVSQQFTANIFEAIPTAAAMFALYLTTLFTSMIVYRLFFSKLRKFPGPKMAAVSKFWHVFQARNSTNHLVMQSLHDQYGDFVRSGPTEITVFLPEAIEAFDIVKFKSIKDEFYDLIHPLTSTVFTRNPAVHKEQRAMWTQGLSTKALDGYAPRLAELVDRVDGAIAELGQKGKKGVNVVDVMTWFSFDAMGEILFGHDFGMINSREYIPAVAHQKRALALMGPILMTGWIPRLAFAFLPFVGRVRDWMQMVSFCDTSIQKRMKEGKSTDKPDLADLFLDQYDRTKGKETPKNRWDMLSGSTISAVVAGSDSTRASFIAVFWFLAKYPEHAEKVYQELCSIPDVHDANALAGLPHFNGVINEALRLLPPVLTGNGRVTGPQGITIAGTYIPPNTKIHAPKYVISRLPSAFAQADEFIPERWYSRPELILDKRAFRPFGVGNRICVGKTLAYVEIRLVTAILLKRNEVTFAPGYKVDEIFTGLKDHVTAQPGQVDCLFTPRQ